MPSLADALRVLREQAQRTPPPQWVRAVDGWKEFQFAERLMPTLEEINRAAPDTPANARRKLQSFRGAVLADCRENHRRTRSLSP